MSTGVGDTREAEQPTEPEAAPPQHEDGPLLSDPPPPPGWTDPLERSPVLRGGRATSP